MIYSLNMTKARLITASEAYQLLGYKNRSSLTRLVQSGRLTPENDGKAEQLFRRVDVERLRKERAA